MKKLFVVSLISSIAIFLLLTFMSRTTVSYDKINSEVILGKKTWQRKACTECHTLFGNGGYNAPDLTKIISEREKSRVESFLINRPVVRTAKAKRHINLTDEEVRSILTYLEFVSTIPTNEWPPAKVLKQKGDR